MLERAPEQGKMEGQHMWMREKETNTSSILKLTEEEIFTKYTLRDEIRPEEKRPANSRFCMNTSYFKKS